MDAISKSSRNFHSNLAKMFLDQEGVDCFFELPICNSETNSAIGKKVIGAHKIILAAASPIFYNLLIEKLEVTDARVIIEISDVYYDDFKWFLWIIYNQRSAVLKDCNLMYPSRLYKLAYKYSCNIVLEVAKEEIQSHINQQPELSFVYLVLARNMKCLDIESFCIQILKTKTSELLKTENFFRTKPAIVAEIFSWNRMNINSEYDLVIALESYMDVNPNTTIESPFMAKARSNIRWLLLTEAQIFETTLLDYKEKTTMLFCRSNHNNHCIKKEMNHLSFERNPRMKLC